MQPSSASFLRALPSAEKDELLKLTTLTELPKSRYATKLAVTAYPHTRRGRKAVFSHIEVYKMVENVAGRMREAGVRPGTVCAFALPTSCESIIYLFALWWIAAIAAPVDPDLPDDQFEDAVTQSGARLLVSPNADDDDPLFIKCASVCKKHSIKDWHIHRTINEGVVLETHGQYLGTGAAWSGGAGDFKLDPDEVAVHVHSQVAIVPLSHNALCAAAKSFVTTYNLAVNMSTMLAPPLYHIHGILILIATFYSGGHIVLPGYGGFDASKFWHFAKKHNITWVSASADQILDLYEENEKSSSSSGKQLLTFVRSSGTTCIAAELLEKVEKSLKTKVYESYGTAEICGFATTNRKDAVFPGTIGRAVDGLQIAVFDSETREMCPPGVTGEIAASGTHVCSSYLNSESATENAVFKTPPSHPDADPVEWFAVGDRGKLDENGVLTVFGDSRSLRKEEVALQEEKKAKELAALAILKAEQEKRAAEETASKEAAAKEAAEKEESNRLEEERRLEQERIAEEERKKVEAEEQAERQRIAREKEEEEERQLLAKEAEEEQMKRAAEEEVARAKKVAEEMEHAERSAALVRAGIENPDELDEETANAILARLEAIEENHRRLQHDVEMRNAAEIEEMRRRVADAEAEAERAAIGGVNENGKMIDLRMEELEAAVMAAAASAESSANNTREAVKAAREVADATYGTNHSQPVEVKASTGDQGALTKTVRVALDDVEAAMRNHPAVDVAKAFGRKDKRFGAEVFCAIVPKRGARVSEPWLKLHAQSVLPAPMVPKKFYYISQMPQGISRRELAESPLLQDLSQFPGYSEVKHVKGPQWKPKSNRRVNA
ncbi:putative peroxisomal-coenzyme A synthetase [Gracilariopsis chorda]|uniref:Putative peroxisomal-coenzyme A synthetase n=1 Tax=Gracilariopsis chorda TaxID=448386 RepID=A0A2V3J2Q8_9FLOR|nr:putative peroxisomal-coenzyme A synthetase [Gracilariopsis chorda]|eukprot:PXF48392.1 putative peroxisomal-coenzyme A synthetase [Gracilariopsis chorda]